MLSLGIDIGTSGVRTAVLNGDTVVATARSNHPAQDPSNIDAGKWWDAVATCLDRQMVALRDAGHNTTDISAVAVDGTSGSMVLTDAELRPVSPALMYNSKGFEAEAAQIAKHVSGDHITSGSNSALARAMRLVSVASDNPRHLLHQADFIAAKLLGHGGHSDFNNTLKTGFDPEVEAWPDWIGNVVDPGLLPKVHAPGERLGVVCADAVARFGFSPDTQVHAGTTDSIAAFLSAAPLEEGVAVTSIGSTLAIKLLSRTRIDDHAIGLYSHRLGDFWLVGGASNTGGAVLANFFTPEELARLSAYMDPMQSTGLDYYPLVRPGERFPINDPDLQPRLDPRPDSDVLFLQGMFEGIARIETQCYSEMKACGAEYPKKIYTAGGGAQNSVWTTIRASMLGLMPAAARYSEAAIGTAILAGSSED